MGRINGFIRGREGKGSGEPKDELYTVQNEIRSQGKTRPLHIPQPHAQSPIRFPAISFKRSRRTPTHSSFYEAFRTLAIAETSLPNLLKYTRYPYATEP